MNDTKVVLCDHCGGLIKEPNKDKKFCNNVCESSFQRELWGWLEKYRSKDKREAENKANECQL